MVQGIMGMYVDEGKLELALDVARKAVEMGQSSAWIEERIRELEGKVGGDLPEPPGGVMEKAEPSAPVPPDEVVKSLEGWLRTIRRRKERLSAGPEGDE